MYACARVRARARVCARACVTVVYPCLYRSVIYLSTHLSLDAGFPTADSRGRAEKEGQAREEQACSRQVPTEASGPHQCTGGGKLCLVY